MQEIIDYIEKNGLNTRKKTDELAYRRYYIYSVLKEYGYTYKQIGSCFNREHSTVIHGVKMHENLLKQNDKLYLELIKFDCDNFKCEYRTSLKMDVLECETLEELEQLKEKITNNFY